MCVFTSINRISFVLLIACEVVSEFVVAFTVHEHQTNFDEMHA